MKNFRIISYLLRLRSSFWFIPFIMVGVSLVLASSIIIFDKGRHVPEGAVFLWVKNIGPSGARAVFSTIAGSTITVAGVIFSIAMVVLTMASSQFGPRLIPTFMRVGKIQFGIGLFIGTFVYCLVMLTFVPEENQAELLPVWGVVCGLALGISAFLVLIMLIHEIATFIQVPNVTERVSIDIQNTFDRLFLAKGDGPREAPSKHSQLEKLNRWRVSSPSSGYIKTIDHNGLVELAEDSECCIELLVKPGRHVIKGQCIGHVLSVDAPADDLLDKLGGSVEVGADRDLAQDPEYAIDQMVEIAVKALSPGINDPFTAINCIDKLSAAIGSLTHRNMSQTTWRDQSKTIRLVTPEYSYSGIIDSSFDQIRQYASDSAAVIMRLVDKIDQLGRLESPDDFRAALESQLARIRADGASNLQYESDREELLNRISCAQTTLSEYKR